MDAWLAEVELATEKIQKLTTGEISVEKFDEFEKQKKLKKEREEREKLDKESEK